MCGTQEWTELLNNDPRKLASLLDASQHWVLRLESNQQAMADASSEVSAAADWSGIAQYIRDERGFAAAHPWLRRRAAS
jgi:hypothetical protein